MRKPMALLGIIGGLLISIAFNNCSPEHSSVMTDQFSVVQGVSFAPCSFVDEADLFSQTYHKFTTKNCNSCHIDGGQGKGVFASPNALTAYNAFTIVGYTKLSEYAVDNGHNPPFTGSKHNDTIELLTEQWVKGLENIEACKGTGGSPDPVKVDEASRAETKSKALNLSATDQTVTLTWNLPSELDDKMGAFTLPAISGSQISITVKRTVLATKPVYLFSAPTLRGGTSTDVKINSIMVRLNGSIIKNQTTFLYVDSGARQGESVRLSPGTMVVDGNVSASDMISLSIGKLEPTTLPAPPVYPRVSFVTSAVSIPEKVNPAAVGSSVNYYSAELQLNTPNDQQYVTVTVGLQGSSTATNRRTTTTVRLPGDGDRDLAIDQWNWDYSVDTLAVVFAPGETRKFLDIKISNDHRDEPNETIRLEVAAVVNAVKDTANQVMVITVQDDDAAPDPEIPSFTSLMRPGGVLYQYCYRCHNSVDNRGGYNLSDYDLMIGNRILVPGDTQSEMFKRMNEPGLRTMPLDGLLDPSLRRIVESWILNGAKND